MDAPKNQTKTKVTIEGITVNTEKLSEELQRRLQTLHEELRRLEEAKTVTQGTMQTEVSI
jgi:hypothetical protein